MGENRVWDPVPVKGEVSSSNVLGELTNEVLERSFLAHSILDPAALSKMRHRSQNPFICNT